MKYVGLIWKFLFWNFICFVGMVFLMAFIAGNPPVILLGATIIGVPLGTIIAIAKYQKSSK
jgi:hypothetical protein